MGRSREIVLEDGEAGPHIEGSKSLPRPVGEGTVGGRIAAGVFAETLSNRTQ
jgi:hypothetical protein